MFLNIGEFGSGYGIILRTRANPSPALFPPSDAPLLEPPPFPAPSAHLAPGGVAQEGGVPLQTQGSLDQETESRFRVREVVGGRHEDFNLFFPRSVVLVSHLLVALLAAVAAAAAGAVSARQGGHQEGAEGGKAGGVR